MSFAVLFLHCVPLQALLRNMIVTKVKEVTQMQSNSTPFSLRIPKELLLRLKRLAKHNKRSANREAEQILEEYLNRWEKEHPLN